MFSLGFLPGLLLGNLPQIIRESGLYWGRVSGGGAHQTDVGAGVLVEGIDAAWRWVLIFHWIHLEVHEFFLKNKRKKKGNAKKK